MAWIFDYWLVGWLFGMEGGMRVGWFMYVGGSECGVGCGCGWGCCAIGGDEDEGIGTLCILVVGM